MAKKIQPVKSDKLRVILNTTFKISMFTGFTPAKVWRANSLSRNHANLSPEQI
jgi:hypothetical protein